MAPSHLPDETSTRIAGKDLWPYYCDQPIVSETMRCVSYDFIKTINDQGQNARGFYV